MKYLEAIQYLSEQNIMKPEADWEITEKKKKRSNDANSYFWVLINKIAEKQRISDTEVHDKLLSENIAYYYNEEGGIDWKVSPLEPNDFGLIVEKIKDDYTYYLDSRMKVKLKKESGEIVHGKDGVDITGRVYWHIKGTHQMNSKEMSRILESTIFEAKKLGIETETEDNIRRMEAAWEKYHG